MAFGEHEDSAEASEAADPQTSPERLKELYDISEYETQLAVAENPNCDEAMHMAFVTIGHGGIRTAVAKNKSLSLSHLAALATDDNEWVRAGVASNESTSPELLIDLAHDESAWVRQNVAQNPNSPPEVLRQLAQEADEDVQQALAENPSLPKGLSRHIFEQETPYSFQVHRRLAENPNTDSALLESLSKSEKPLVRAAVAGHSHCSLEIALALAQDTDSTVRAKLAERTSFDEVLKILAVDSEEDVRGATYENPAASEPTRASAVLLGLPKKDEDES
jgi:hypothetical protein